MLRAMTTASQGVDYLFPRKRRKRTPFQQDYLFNIKILIHHKPTTQLEGKIYHTYSVIRYRIGLRYQVLRLPSRLLRLLTRW